MKVWTDWIKELGLKDKLWTNERIKERTDLVQLNSVQYNKHGHNQVLQIIHRGCFKLLLASK